MRVTRVVQVAILAAAIGLTASFVAARTAQAQAARSCPHTQCAGGTQNNCVPSSLPFRCTLVGGSCSHEPCYI